jgi:hypothetical protein
MIDVQSIDPLQCIKSQGTERERALKGHRENIQRSMMFSAYILQEI